ncbi:MAG: GNAT family N-acetyltransferase [Bacilli bacterium]|nr:GNAT family N-acetyltransferase [Bacilli bacterium]
MIFESDRIIYVKPSEKYMEDYIKMYTDRDIQKSLFKNEYHDNAIIGWIKKLIKENNYTFSMIDKNTKEFIGNIEIIKKDDVAEIMISITPSKQGRHYATEAIKSIIEYGRKELEISNYDLNVYKNNEKAIHIYEKVGFTQDNKNISEDSIHMIL